MKKTEAWVGVLRLWSLTAATIPVLVGSALAWRDGCFSSAIFVLTMASGWALQLAVNLLNTYGDFHSGVDRGKRCADSEALITGAVTPRQALLSAIAFAALGALFGVGAAALSSWKLLLFAVPGFIGLIGYTTGVKFKYMGLGVPIVFLLMGVVMVTAAHYAHSASLSWTALAVSLPVASLVAVILHGNDLRDFESDSVAGIRTIALMLGLQRGKRVFCAFHASAYIAVAAGAALGLLPLWTLLVLLAAPLSLRACRTCLTAFRPGAELPEAQSLVALSAQTHLLFGILLAAGVALG